VCQVPLKPTLGCIAVAPDFGFAPFSTGEQGRYGGNLDFNEITEGSTIVKAAARVPNSIAEVQTPLDVRGPEHHTKMANPG